MSYLDTKKLFKVLDKMKEDKEKNIKILKRYYNLNQGQVGRELEKLYHLNSSVGSRNESTIKVFEALLEISKEYNLLHVLDFNEIIRVSIKSLTTLDYLIEILSLATKNNIDINDKIYEYDNEKDHECLFFSLSTYCQQNELSTMYNALKDAGYNIFSTYLKYIPMTRWLIISYNNNEDVKQFLEQLEKERKEILSLSNEEILKRAKKDYPSMHNDEELSGNMIVYKAGRTILFDYVRIYIDEEYSLRIIEALLASGINPNHRSINGYRFVEYAVANTKHNEYYIYKLLEIAIKYGYDVNGLDFDRNTIMHKLISSNNKNISSISNIYQLLLDNGYDTNIRNNKNKTINDLIKEYKSNFNDSDEVIKTYSNYAYNNVNDDLKYLNKFKKKLDISNSYLIDKSIKKKDNKINFIIGKYGIGKKDNLKRLYSNDNNEAIYITKEDILNECELISDYKAKLLNIIRLCSFNNITLYIENLDEIINHLKDIDKKEVLMIIDLYHRKYKLELNTTIHDKKIIEEVLINDIDNEIVLNDPSNEDLETLIIIALSDYETKYNKKIENIDLLEEIINILIKNKNNDEISNLKIIFDFINDLFINSNNNVKISDIINSIYNLKNINNSCKRVIINELNNINNNKDYDNAVKRIKKKF